MCARAGFIGTKSYMKTGEAKAFKVYMGYLLANCLFCAGYTLRAIMVRAYAPSTKPRALCPAGTVAQLQCWNANSMRVAMLGVRLIRTCCNRSAAGSLQDIERYCEETQDHDADCEDESAQTGVSVLFVYQATQMLSMWGAWSLYVGIRDPASVSPVMQYPVVQPVQPQQAYVMPVDPEAPSTASHGHEMAIAAGKHKHSKRDGHGNGKHRKEHGKHKSGDKHKSGGDEYEPSSWDTPKSGKGGKVRAYAW